MKRDVPRFAADEVLASTLVSPQVWADYAHFALQLKQKTGIDLTLYKEAQMLRRLFALVERSGMKTFREYAAYLQQDPAELTVLLDRMTINVSELFRNAEKWEELERVVLPELLGRRNRLRLWSAGCSYGAEPYSLTLLLEELTPGVRHTIHATDLDRSMLERAQRGRFTFEDLAAPPASRFQRCFLKHEKEAASNSPSEAAFCWEVLPSLRERVMFRQHNLLADAFESDYDLICCRNVVIYFTEAAKEQLYQKFYDALAPGGYLFIGGTERIFHYGQFGFEMPLPFLYRKLPRRSGAAKPLRTSRMEGASLPPVSEKPCRQ